MRVTANYLDNVRFEVHSRGHSVRCDQPAHNGGQDDGMTPPEFLLASLATCAGYYAIQYLRTKGIFAGGVQVQVTAEKKLRPARLAALHLDITAPELDAEQEAGLLRAVNACLIHNTLMHPPVVNTTIRRPAGSLAARSEGSAAVTGAAGA